MLLVVFLLVLISFFVHSIRFEDELYSSNYQLETTSFITQFISKFSPNCELNIAFQYELSNSTSTTDSFLDPIFYSKKLGEIQHAGVYLLNYSPATNAFLRYPRFKDIHRIAANGSCGVNVILLHDLNIGVDDEKLFNFLTPRYEPITRKDEDYFFFITQHLKTAEAVLISSNAFGNKIKFKVAFYPSSEFRALTANIYGNNGEPLLTTLNVSPDSLSSGINMEMEADNGLPKVFPDFTRNFHGRALRMSVANVPFRFEIELRSDGRFHPKRGFHKLWLDEAMKKFNFTYDIFVSSLGGGTGKQFDNGSWGGSVGDILYGKADIAYQIAHIYNRHKFVEWASPFTYEAIIFIAHKPRTYFSPNAIFWPFTPTTWALFMLTLVASIICYKFLAVSYTRIKYGNTAENSWSNLRVLEYIIATFLEQDRGGPSNMPFHPIRIFCSVWLIFALVTATAYRAKLTPLMAFPLTTFVPITFEELVESDFGVGLNVVGKGDAAYTIFSLGRGKVYEGIFGKMGIYPDAVECVLKAVSQDFCCMIWDGYAEYIDAKNVSDKFGRSPLQMSETKTSFIEDGLVFEKRSIFRKHFDTTVRNAVNMGLTKKWLKMDLESVKQTRHTWEKSVDKPARIYNVDHGPVKLKVAHFVGSFIIWVSGLVVSFVSFVFELCKKYYDHSEMPFKQCSNYGKWHKTDLVSNLKARKDLSPTMNSVL
ncbi:unnamed protein product [Orchesella dallaii]|uniref:Ionotropic glutamate receptor L-glutamate and glycine-binding domain-containing protein n=1 Tax=Orchesella dallaii TaxID=48710 RepID=A0ABP1PT70_9HEXA